MFQFSNAYSCSVDSNRETVAIQFSQRCPHFDENGDIDKTALEAVSSIIMNRDTAISLGNALIALFSDDEDVPAID